MKLTHVLAPVAYGGGERLLRELVEEFSNRGLAQHFILLCRSEVFEKQLQDINIPFTCLSDKAFSASPTKFDYCVQLLLALFNLLFLRNRLKKITKSSLLFAHGFPANIFGCFLSCKLRCYVNHSVKKQMNVVARFIYMVLMKSYSRIISVGPYAHKSYCSVFPELAQKCFRIDNGVSNIFFHYIPKCYGEKRKKTACYIARFSSTKNHAFLLDVLTKVNGFNLLLAGDGDLLELIKSKANRLGLADRITFLGNVEPERVPVVLEQCDFVLFPSKGEGFGLALAEAIVMGRPAVLFSNVYDEVFGTGCLSACSETEFIEMTQKIVESSELRLILSDNCLAERKRFLMAVCAEKYIDIISSVAC